ncbi:MAG: radical SAM protein [Planctomycetota bacterium]
MTTGQTKTPKIGTFGNATGERALLGVQIAGMLAILLLVPGNLFKAVALAGWFLVTFGRMTRSEAVLYVGGCALFSILDILSVRKGVFAFASPDFAGLPYWEFLLWGFYLLHTRRMVGASAPKRGLILPAMLAVAFGIAICATPGDGARLAAGLSVLAVSVAFFHAREDLLCVGYMALLGVVVEYAGVLGGLWSYPESPIGGAPAWFVIMWGGVGLFMRRLGLPVVGRLSGDVAAGNNAEIKTRRPLSINNSLSHGLCNYSCRLCAVNKPSYRGPKQFQPREVTEKLIARVEEAASAGVPIRYITNAGDGEPTLHPEFTTRMDLFGDMLRKWTAPVAAPEVSVVTNGSRLTHPGILESIARNRLTLIVSFPTCRPETYGAMMRGEPERGAALLASVVPGIEQAMRMVGRGEIRRLYFHISPPEREEIRRDFPATVEFLASRAKAAGMKEIEMVLFPATSNRSGLVRNRFSGTDMYKDLFEAWNGKAVCGVTVRMNLVLKRFFANTGEIADLVRAFRFPCLWNANFFIAADGSSICCNDQAVREPMGNIRTSSLKKLLMAKERRMPGMTCAGCDQRPERMTGSPAAVVFAGAARVRLAMARMAGWLRKDEAPGLPEDMPRAIPAPAAPIPSVVSAPAVNRLPKPATADRFSRSESLPATRARLTEILRALEVRTEEDEPDADYRFGADGEYRVRIAASINDRRKAWVLAYEVYRGRHYAGPEDSGLWYSLFDAIPATTTFLAEKSGIPVAALTLVMDGPMGLPADELYRDELGILRSQGRRACEIVSLVSTETGVAAGAEVVKHLFKIAWITAHHLESATDFVITVNPRHVPFYQRALLFDVAGTERSYNKVGGAPAVLLRLDLVAAWDTYREKFDGLLGSRNLYRFFLDRGDEIKMWVRRRRRPLAPAEFRRWFVEKRPLFADASPRARKILESVYGTAPSGMAAGNSRRVGAMAGGRGVAEIGE